MPLVQASYEQQIALLPEPSYDGPYDIDQDPVWQYQPQAPAFKALDWYQCDHLGTPLELTDQHGEMVWRADYHAWGQAQVRLSEAAQRRKLDTALRFQGQYLDVETGLHYNRYRYYDPQVGRFVSADPIGYAGGLNLYQYAPNPVAWTDPLGLAAHRGRIQAQGDKLEQSGSWNQDTPFTAEQAKSKIEELKGKLSKKELNIRDSAFKRAERFINNACSCGGVEADSRVSFKVKETAHERVDIEVNSGIAFTEK
ncbi:RHS repeat domain-containing protein [Pseudomonas sp. NPDC088890]